MSIFDKWNANVDIEGLQHDVEEAAANGGGDFVEVPHGTYEVAIDKMELRESKKGDPMFTCWFKVLEGEFKNSRIFMNQVITQGFQIHIVNEFIKSLNCGVNDVRFVNYAQYNDLVLDVFEACDGKLEFALDYGENKKGYNTFTIEDVFEVEG